MKIVKRIKDNAEIGVYLGQVLFLQDSVDGISEKIDLEAEKARQGQTDCVYVCCKDRTLVFCSAYEYFLETA